MLIRITKPITNLPVGKVVNAERIERRTIETPTRERVDTWFEHRDGNNVYHITPDMCEEADADIEELRKAVETYDQLLKFAGHACSAEDCSSCALIAAARKFIPKG